MGHFKRQQMTQHRTYRKSERIRKDEGKEEQRTGTHPEIDVE